LWDTLGFGVCLFAVVLTTESHTPIPHARLIMLLYVVTVTPYFSPHFIVLTLPPVRFAYTGCH